MSKQRLVVIGNGMAGARTVEEILARGGADLFDITMFGDEPYGNYNRILLSNVVNGSQDAERDLPQQPALVRDERHPPARRRARRRRSTAWRERVHGAGGVVEPYDKLIIATGSRPFIPPIKGVLDGAGKLRPGVFVFRTLDDCHAIVAAAATAKKAAVIGGGLLGLEAARGLLNHGCEVHVIHLSTRLMNQQLDPAGGRDPARDDGGDGRHTCTSASDTPQVLVEGDRLTGLALQGRQRCSTATWW